MIVEDVRKTLEEALSKGPSENWWEWAVCKKQHKNILGRRIPYAETHKQEGAQHLGGTSSVSV